MPDSKNKKLFLTGASGLLGRAVHKKFIAEGWNVYGAAFSRAKKYNLHVVDITKKEEVRKAILDFQPKFIIHAAAQRFPDKVDKDPNAAQVLNVDATQFIIDAAGEIGAPVIYISTDYVFDGKANSPYRTTDTTNPVNLYGKTKLEGEVVTLKSSKNIVLRVPVLYGPVIGLKESAVTSLLETLLTPDKPVTVSDWEWRCPSHVDDIAVVCFQLLTACNNDQDLSGVFQWCGKEKMTKYHMVLKMAEVLKLPHSHVVGDNNPPQGTAARPYDTELDCSRLTDLGFGAHTPFQEGIHEALKSWLGPQNNMT